MLLRTHLAGAAFIAAAFAPPHSPLPAAGACLIGAWFPDIDLHLLVLDPSRPFATGALRHRGFTHSVVCLALVLGAAALVLHSFRARALFLPLLFFAAGFLSHVFLDSLTLSPVYFFWPSSRELWLPPRWGFRGIRSGGPLDTILLFVLLLMAAASLLWRLPPGPLTPLLVSH